MAFYPGAIPTLSDLFGNRIDGDEIPATDHNQLVAEIIALATELGKTSSPAAGSVRERLAHGRIENELLVSNSQNVTLAGNVNDQAVNATTSVLRLTATGSTRDLTGITGGVAGRMLVVRNVGATISIVLRNDNSGSAAANRFLLGSDVTLTPHQAVLLQWDTADNRWDVVASWSGSGGGGGFTWTPQGEWDDAVTYAVDDVVYYDNGTITSSYIAIVSNTNSTPDNHPANWVLLAPGGVKGDPGDDGISVTGPKGDPGPSRETVLSGDISGDTEVDAADGSYRLWTLVNNATITPVDTSGVSASAITLRIFQGGSGSNTITWASFIKWIGNAGDPPDLATVVGQGNEVVLEQVEGVWWGFIPGQGENVTPPPDVFTDLDFEVWLQEQNSSALSGIGNYTLGTATQIGIKRGVAAYVVTTRDDGADPPIPTLAGGGASSWTFGATVTFGTSTTRRRATLFFARDTSNAAAAPYTIGLAAAGASNTGCALKVVRTKGIVDTTWLALALSTVRTRKYNDAGELSTLAQVTLDVSPQDAADRTLMFVASAIDGTMTPGGTAVEIGTKLVMTSPSLSLWAIADLTAYEDNPEAAVTSANWGAIGFENEQGGVFTPPPSGPPPVAIEVILAGYDTTDQTADYVTSAAGFTASVGNGASVLVGDNRMSVVDVITTTGITADPNQPTLAGGGITSWDVPTNGSRVVGSGANRMRITRFIGWQASADAATPLTVGVGGQATTGIEILMVRTPITDAGVFALAKSTTKKRYYLDASEVASGPAGLANDQLAVPGTDSIVYSIAAWRSSLVTLGTITPEAGLTQVSSTGMGGSPAVQMVATKSTAGAYDRTPSISWTGGTLNWGFIASEIGQAV